MSYYNGYTRRDSRRVQYFVEYTLCDSTLRTAGYKEESEARQFVTDLQSGVLGGENTFVRIYRVFRGQEKPL